ncbi:MAG TPA: zinc-binding dehydrogenase [Actinomycetota bacterium]|nr:zinc-binding dehydrogenase [Actinomycetota bacterium]
MLAARWWGRRDVRVERVPDPRSPAPGWVLLRIEACGICGTDLEEYRDGPNVIPTEPHPLSGVCAPLILGHESVGRVVLGGPGATLPPDTRVAVESTLYCGTCWWCVRGQHNLCVSMANLGLMADGGLAEYMLAPQSMCRPVAEHVTPEHAALSEPLAVAVRAVRAAGVGQGSNVAVVGAGTVGLLVTQVARARGAGTVVVVDGIEQRRRLAQDLGADVAVAPDEAMSATRDLMSGVGPDATIEAAGNPAAAASAVTLTRKGGRAVLLGVFEGEVRMDMMDMLLGEKTVVACLSHDFQDDFVPAVSLIEQGVVRVAPLVTDRVALSDVVDQGFEALLNDPEGHLKIVVTP